MTPDRIRRLKKIGMHAGFGLAVFIIAFYFSFPYDRVRDQVVAMAALQGLDVEIESAGPTIGFGVAFENIAVASRPTDGKKPLRFRIDDAKVRVSPLAALAGHTAYSVDAEAFGGGIDLHSEATKTAGHTTIDAEGLAFAELPGIKDGLGLPVSGTIELGLDLTTPQMRNAEASGSVNWVCRACVIGDDKAKLRVEGNPLLSEGIIFPKLRLGDFTGQIAFDKGTGKLQAVQAKSPDGDIAIEGQVRLADPIGYSYLDLYVRFKPTEALLKRSDKLKLMMQLADSMGGKRPDGAYGFRLTGTFQRLGSPQWSRTSPFTSTPVGRPTPAPRPPTRTASSTVAPLESPPAGTTAPVMIDREVDPAKTPNANLPRYPTMPPEPDPVSAHVMAVPGVPPTPPVPQAAPVPGGLPAPDLRPRPTPPSEVTVSPPPRGDASPGAASEGTPTPARLIP